MRNYFLKAGMISVISAFATSMSLPHVCLFGAVKSHSKIARVKLLAQVYMDETLNELTGDETDLIVVQLNEDLTTFKNFYL